MKQLRKQFAFTLIELLMVVAILSILAGILLPSLGNSSTFQLTSAARELNSILLYTQNLAITNQQKYQLVFDTANNEFEVLDESGTLIEDPGQVTPGVTVNPDIYKLKRQYSQSRYYSKVSITQADFDSKAILWFDRLGMPYSGPITDNTPLTTGHITLTAKNDSMTLNIEPVSGNIKIN